MDHHSKEEIPQFLKDLKSKDSGYKLPPDYFAKMQDSVISQVVEQKTVNNFEFLDNLNTWYHLLFKSQYGYIGLATIALMIAFVSTRDYSTGIPNSFANLDDTDLDYFIEYEIDDLHDQDVMATLSTEEMDFNNYSFPIVSVDITIPEDYIEDLDNTDLIDFDLED